MDTRRPSPRLLALLAEMRESRFHQGVFCVHCGHRGIQRWGTFRGRQRYRCKGCRRTFSDLTGTPAAHLKKPELLPTYVRCLEASLSVRRAAFFVGIDPGTSFRWRHRLCEGLRIQDDERVTGWVELASTWLPESRKGERNLDRPPRRRGSWHEARAAPQVHVVLACDRTGHQIAVHDRQPASPGRTFPPDVLEAAIRDLLAPPVQLTAEEGPFGRFARVARRLRVPYVDARRPRPRLDPGPRVESRAPGGVMAGTALTLETRRAAVNRSRHLARTDRAKGYRRRFKGWLAPFCGVATKYLANYMVWHRRLEADHHQGMKASALRWPATVPDVA